MFDQMLKYEYLDSLTADSVKQLPVIAQNNITSHMRGKANHFRTFLRVSMTADRPVRSDYGRGRKGLEAFERDSTRWYHDPLYGWIAKNPRPDGTNYNIYKDGLQIHTTLNMKMQEYAEISMKEHLSEFLQPAFFYEKEGRPFAPFEEVDEEAVESIMNAGIMQSEYYRKLKGRDVSWDSILMKFNEPRETKVFSWNGMIDTILSPYDSIRYMKHILRSGFMAVEPWSGHVKAYIGDHTYRYFQYDHVTQGRRQVGSTVKPFLYLMAMQEKISPCKQIPLVPITFPVGDTTWTPGVDGRNSYAGQYVSLKWGLAHSHNWVSAWLFKTFYPGGIGSMITIMKKMGITSYIDPVPSMILGPSDISLEEMVGAFNTFGNQGIYVSPTYVTRIEDKYGNLISTFQPREVEAIDEETAYLMLTLLKEVVNKGTAGRLRCFYQFEGEMAGNTGTTQNQRDGWLIGITPQQSAGVWVGCEDRSAHFDELGMGSGGRMAMPIWAKFFESVYADSNLGITEEEFFDKPECFYVDLDCDEPTARPSSSDFNDF